MRWTEDVSVYFEMIAEIHGIMGDFEAGLRAIDNAFEQARRSGIMFWNAELHRRRGELLVAYDKATDPALASFREAITCARSQGARMLELRASTSLVRNVQPSRMAVHEARELRALLDSLVEGQSSCDVTDARALLATLQ